MNIHSIAGLVFFCAATALSGATLDDKIKSFEDLVKQTPEAPPQSPQTMWPRGRTMTVDDLDLVLHQGGNNGAGIEQVVRQLMATHPSEPVRLAGEAIILELDTERKAQAAAYETKAKAALSEVTDAVTHAKTAADLDGILKELQALQNPQGNVYGFSTEIANKIPTTFQFVTQWQNYLAAANAGNWQEAQNALRTILYSNSQIDSPTFFPRSVILTKYEEAFRGGVKLPDAPESSAPGSTVTDPDVILAKMQKPEDVENLLPDLARVPAMPGQTPWDWTELYTLAKARDDSLAHFTVLLDLKKAMNWNVWGDQISRITAMELLAILPAYFGTDVSDPPKAKETLTAYLDRLSNEASTAGNLALLQRVVSVQVALGDATVGGTSDGTKQFLAGLSQDAAGQYDAAVVSYEGSLKNPDRFLPVKIVGERLAAIKAEHPDDFTKGMTTFLTPPVTNPFGRPGMPYWARPGPPQSPQIEVLPIPMTISIPSTATTPSAAPNSNAPTETK